MNPKLANWIYARLLVTPGMTASEITKSADDKDHEMVGAPITLARVVGHLTMMKSEKIVKARRAPDMSKPPSRIFRFGQWQTVHQMVSVYYLNPAWKPKEDPQSQ